jgi:hypothetical protein
MLALGRKSILQLVRILWIVVAVGFASYFIAGHYRDLAEFLRSLGPTRLAGAFALLVAAKLVYTANILLMLRESGANSDFAAAFRAYAVSQLGKYIPGSIWQFVGRIDIYRDYGMHTAAALRLLLLENAALLATAGLVGLLALPKVTSAVTELISVTAVAVTVGLGAVSVFALALALRRSWSDLPRVFWSYRGLAGYVLGLFFVMWSFMGLSAYALVPEAGDISALYVVSLFALSYACGFVSIFAPAGFGVREAVLTAGLATLVGAPIAVGVAIAHRVLYVLADLALGCIGLLIATPPKTEV